MFPRISVTSWLVAVSLLAGCGERISGPVTRPARPELAPVDAANDSQSGDPSHASAGNESEVPSPQQQIDLIEANWSVLQSLVSDQKGKIVVVDVWSTACEPCMKEFPHLIRLQTKYPDDVVAISFDIDYAGIKNKPPAYYRERVLKFLGSQSESKVLHRMCDTAAEDLFTEIKLDSIPAVYVYGRDGTLAKRFDGSNSSGEEVSYVKQVIPFVDGLVQSH